MKFHRVQGSQFRLVSSPFGCLLSHTTQQKFHPSDVTCFNVAPCALTTKSSVYVVNLFLSISLSLASLVQIQVALLRVASVIILTPSGVARENSRVKIKVSKVVRTKNENETKEARRMSIVGVENVICLQSLIQMRFVQKKITLRRLIRFTYKQSPRRNR